MGFSRHIPHCAGFTTPVEVLVTVRSNIYYLSHSLLDRQSSGTSKREWKSFIFLTPLSAFKSDNCPFRGCAGNWVKLGVAKRHGAVLGDAVSKMADENTKVQLVESDIPGAELPKPAEFCTVAILKRWLSCRGAKVSGNRMSFSYKRLTLASLGKVWNFFSGEFLQLFVHPGTQQLNLPILHLTTSTKTQGNEEFKQMASPKTAPWRFATPNLTQSPAQPRNGQWDWRILWEHLLEKRETSTAKARARDARANRETGF